MRFISTMAWRNLWRNPLRSTALLSSIALGVVAGLLAAGFTKGILNQRFNEIIEKETSHIQIHHPDYRSELEAKFFIPNSEEIMSILDAKPEIVKYTTRTLANGLVASAAAASGVSIIGVDPSRELEVTGFHEKLVEGSYFEEPMRNPVLVGKKLADKLNLRMGSRIVLSFQDVEGEIISAAFRVAGIYRTNNAMNDESRVYVQQADLQTHLANEKVIHQIAILLQDYEKAHEVSSAINGVQSSSLAQPWDEISLELKFLLDQGDISTYIFMIIIMLGLGFGILNTMLMAVFERTREIGMLLALGMNKTKVFGLVMLETLIVAMSGAGIGMALGYTLTLWLRKTGVNLGDGMAEFGYDSFVRPAMDASTMINIGLLVFIIALLAAIYPSLKAIRLVPAEAVRK